MGCFLIITEKDLNQLTTARQRVLLDRVDSYRKAGLDDARIEALKNRLDSLSRDDSSRFAEVLSDPRLRDGSAQQALAKGLSNPALDDEMAIAIPAALEEIFGHHPEATGFFYPLVERGPGARAWARSLSHSSHAQACASAYELLATRRLMYQAAGDLKIDPADKINYGIKLQANYSPSNLKSQELLGVLIERAPKRWGKYAGNARVLGQTTVESDILIGRPGVNGMIEDIFVDFKHTTGTIETIRVGELLGIAVALSTGEISEAHFVCNAGISQTVRQQIDDINTVMRAWGHGTIKPHEHYHY